MHFLKSLLPSLLLAGIVQAAGWGIDDAVISVSPKGSSSGLKEKISASAPLSKDIILGPTESLKIVLTATEDGSPKRPHQAFLLLKDEDTGLETSFPFSMKESGKGNVDFSQRDLPVQFHISQKTLRATLLLASFGTSEGFSSHVFNLKVKHDASSPLPAYTHPVRYGKKPVINHIFKEDPKSGPKIISIFFVFTIAATIPLLLGTWVFLGANLNHLPKATYSAPLSYILFFSSILAMEGIFFMYYSSWRLYQVLPAAGAVGLFGFLSGSKALSEVQSRRLAGER